MEYRLRKYQNQIIHVDWHITCIDDLKKWAVSALELDDTYHFKFLTYYIPFLNNKEARNTYAAEYFV